MNERLAELRELQDSITARRRDDLIGEKMTVLVDEIGVARSHREAPEIDGVVHVSETLSVATFVEVEIADALGPDLVATGANRDANHDANELVDDAS
jgi:tRNA A37 methylthiotransferase MiaB